MLAFHPTNHSMFDFLSKLFSSRNDTKLKSPLSTLGETSGNSKTAQGVIKGVDQDQELLAHQRQIWKQKLDAAINNEVIVLEMLFSCDFADGRLYASQHVHSQQGLEQIKNFFRKSDKRVTKLAMSRLEAIHQQEKNSDAVKECMAHAVQLLSLDFLLPSHLIQLDTQKQAVTSFPENFLSEFLELRSQLELRMKEQVQLQRRVLNLIDEVERHLDKDEYEVNDLQQRWQQELSLCMEHPSAKSLPKHTVQLAEATLARHQAKISVLRQKSEEGLVSSVVAHAGYEVSDSSPAINSYTEDLIETASKSPAANTSKSSAIGEIALTAAQFEFALDGFERALQDGSFQQARPFEKQLRDVVIATAPNYVSRQQKDRLSQARKQFNHLLSWAKWSGDASREELVSTAEGLAHLKLDPNEIVDTVTALRTQWKQMEVTSGGAPKDLWLRFDVACSAAYAPAAEHFQQQAELRKNNIAKAEQKLSEMQVNVDAVLQAERNWKAIGGTIQQMQQDWKRLGPVDRKEKNRLDQQFESMLKQLTVIFDDEQELATQERRELVLQAKAIDASTRNAADQVRTLQTKWQNSASHISLERKLEQSLWLEFRGACDTLFDARKQAAIAADQGRQEHLQLRQAVCERLEQFVAGDIAELNQFRQKINAEWNAIGAVPRQSEGELNRRFERGLERLKHVLQSLETQLKLARLDGILKLLNINFKAEAYFNEHILDEEKWTLLREEWASLEIPKNKASRSLMQRWERLLQLFDSGRDTTESRRVLIGNEIEVDHIVLNLEILLQLESPAELAQERRKVQLEILQKSLKQGKDQEQAITLLSRLLSLPVTFNLDRQTRVKAIVQNAAELVLAT